MTPAGIRYAEHLPHPDLRSILECYWIVRDPARQARRDAERIVPDACPEIILHLGDPFARQVGTRWTRQPRMFVAGTLSRPWRLKPGASVDTVGVRFRPGAITTLLPVDMTTAVDRETPLTTWFPAKALTELSRRLASTSPSRRVRVLDEWLRPRLATIPPRGNDVTRAAVARILETRGNRRIEDVAADCGIPRRRLERLFARDLGIRPKLFARIVRLNDALSRLERDARDAAVDVAVEAGYFDQSHMSRDFKAVAGRGLLAPRDADGAMARHFTRPERLLKWLAGE